MKHVYLSPHLDDAVMSCGGIIHRQASSDDQVLVITIFAGDHQGGEPSPFALVQHGYWGNPPHPMLLRRAEDTAALALLGANVCHLDYLDAVYRAAPNGEWLYADEESLWQSVSPDDPLAREEGQAMADQLGRLLLPADQTVVYAPLGVGRHVDHQIVHAAARGLLQKGYRLAFYEEVPYAMTPGATELAVTAAGAENWEADPVALAPDDLAAKVSALSYYRSQMYVLFGGIENMPSRIWAFAASRVPGIGLAEQLWWLPARANEGQIR
jgi:LmbE family N-acetylglucosaminyl deacetylase